MNMKIKKNYDIKEMVNISFISSYITEHYFSTIYEFCNNGSIEAHEKIINLALMYHMQERKLKPNYEELSFDEHISEFMLKQFKKKLPVIYKEVLTH